MSKKESHLAMILSIINRISQNNLILKGWTVVSIPVFFVLSENSGHEYFIHLAYLITIVLWMFDGYLLFKQRLYMGGMVIEHALASCGLSNHCITSINAKRLVEMIN